MIRQKLAVHTDVIADYLVHHGGGAPALRTAMMKFFCYTTVFNAIELFAMSSTESERTSVAAAMSAMKILGLNAKNAMRYGAWYAANPGMQALPILVAGICVESKLPLLTNDRKAFRGFKGLTIVSPSSLGRDHGAAGLISPNFGKRTEQ